MSVHLSSRYNRCASALLEERGISEVWMRSRSVVGIVVLLAAANVGCQRLVTSMLAGDAGGPLLIGKKSACDLVTDGEIASAAGAAVDTRKGDDSTCDWKMKDGGQIIDIHLALLIPLAARLIPQLGTPVPVEGLGEKAQWTQGMVQDLRVQLKDERVLYLLLSPSPHAVVGGTKIEPGKVIQHSSQTGANGTKVEVSTQQMIMDNPAMKAAAIEIAKNALKRL
jgi:hypothetical protein